MIRRSTVFLAALALPTTIFAQNYPLPVFIIFTDVPSTHPHSQAIMYVRGYGIADGYSDETFHPDEPINRAEFVKIVVNALQLPTDRATDVKFSDVHSDDWFAPYVSAAVQSRLIAGYGDGKFKPASPINAAEAAKIMANAYVNTKDQEPSPYFPWYKLYVDALAEQNALPDTITSLEAPLTRGQMAEMIYRLQTKDTTKPSKTYDDFAGPQSQLLPFSNPAIPLSFLYPMAWGDMELTQDSSLQDQTYVYRFSELGQSSNVDVFVVPYAGNADLQSQKRQIDKSSHASVAGFTGTITDSFNGDGSFLSREFIFFTRKYRVIIVAKYYDLASLYPSRTGINTFVLQDLATDAADPIHRLLQKHPDQKDMKQFYADVDAFVKTMKFE